MNSQSPDVSPPLSPPVADDDTLVQDELDRERSRDLSRQTHSPPGAIPGYSIVCCLGEGSFGSVWLAKELNTGKQVAVKFYSHRRGLDWSLLSREVEKLAVLYTSRNVVGLLDVGWDHDPPYFVMEYLEQGSLAARLADGPLPVDQAVHIAQLVARALVQAHGSGILHCDVKPANVLLDGNQEPRLADFGQSRLSDDQTPALGTLFYMAPEQADLEAVPDARWDVYALGALLYHMLVGRPPFRTEEFAAKLEEDTALTERLETYRRLIAEAAQPDAHRRVPGVDRALADVVDRCLSPDVARRYANTQAVLDALEARDEARAKRPLIALGFLGPILFLLAMSWIAVRAIPRAVDVAQQNQVDLALGRDEVAATLLADAVEQEFHIRLDELRRLSELPELRQFILEADDGAVEGESAEERAKRWRARESPLDAWFRDAVDRLNDQGREPDESWFIQNARGDQLTRRPTEDTVGRNYNWRSYFHGGTEEFDPDEVPAGIGPKTTAGISTAFRSQATNKYMVALAVPVWDEDHIEVIGILARTLHLTDLLSPWEHRIRGEMETRTESERFIALVDTRKDAGFLLDHEWMKPETLEGRTDEEIEEQLRLDEATLSRLDGQPQQFPKYRDPVGDLDSAYAGDWLAAFAPIKETGWYAIVQESSGAALEPVEAVTGVFWQSGGWALVVFSLMLGILWYLIHRASA